MAAAVSYGGEVPPEDIRLALLALLNRDGDDLPAGFVAAMQEATREVLRRAFVMFAEEVDGPVAGE